MRTLIVTAADDNFFPLRHDPLRPTCATPQCAPKSPWETGQEPE
jgi:hypothetical protein